MDFSIPVRNFQEPWLGCRSNLIGLQLVPLLRLELLLLVLLQLTQVRPWQRGTINFYLIFIFLFYSKTIFPLSYWAKTLSNTKFEIIGSKGLNLHLSIRIRLWINILTQLYLNREYFNLPVESKVNIQSIYTDSKKIDNYTLNSLAVKENSILLNKIQINSITKHIQNDLCLNVKGTNI